MSKTQQAIAWLLEPSAQKRTLAQACREFGLKNPEGLGLALKRHRIRFAAEEHNEMMVNRCADPVLLNTWFSIYNLIK